MDFQYTEEQQLLADSINRLIDRDYDFETRQKIVASPQGYSPELWNSMAEMGLMSLPFSTEDGGYGGGTTDMIAVMQAIGTGLVVEPYVSTMLAGRVVARAGSVAQRKETLPGIVDGSIKLAFGHTERNSRYDLAHVECRAQRAGDGWTLDGEKVVVAYAPIADRLLVTARTAQSTTDSNGVSLFLVDPKTEGVTLKTYRTVDNLRAADITFAGVKLAADALVGEAGGAFDAIEEAVDFATVLACCEAVGAMLFANATTLDYLKTRKQFGVPIGSFQALQHRMVDMTISAEQSRSISYLACTRFDAVTRGEVDAVERRRVVSAAKIKVSDACRHVGQESIQLHGGMGMTQELKVSHTFKRLTVLAQLFGDVDYHLERFAATG